MLKKNPFHMGAFVEPKLAQDVQVEHLNLAGVKAALNNAGYLDPNNDIRAARYTGMGSGGAIYEISYYDSNDGGMRKGKVYVVEKNGRFYAEY